MSIVIQRILLFGFCLLCSVGVLAEDLSGVVVDDLRGVVRTADLVPVAYASVYLKSDPARGTVTDNRGFFSLSLEGARKRDVVVSYIGYERVMLPLKGLTEGDTLFVTLVEQPILLEESVVSARSKRVNKRRAMKELLRLVENKMEVDFPDTPHKYQIVSDFYLYGGGNVMVFDELFGNAVEMPRARENGQDSIQIMTDVSKGYIDAHILHAMDSLGTNLLGEREKAMVRKVDTTSVMHRYLWGVNIKSMFAQLDKSPRHWSVSRENDSVSVLTFVDNKNFLGVVKASLTVNFIIGTYSLGVVKMTQNMNVAVNIPFGYKLKKDELAFLNMVNFTGEDFTKYRVKKGDMNILRNVIYEQTGRETVVKEKNLVAQGSITDNKGNALEMNNTARISVLSFQTSGVVPYSQKELDRKVVRTIIPINQVK